MRLSHSHNNSQAFYGMLIDSYGVPSAVFCRMVDALFTYMDQNCTISEYRRSGVIEPAKYMWMTQTSSRGSFNVAEIEHFTDLVVKVTRDYYDAAGASYSLATAPTGQQWAILDRRGLLDIAVFNIMATPDHAFEEWNQIIAAFKLKDPFTRSPFPTPIPRSCFPARSDHILHPASTRWSQQALADADVAHAIPSRFQK